jgi:hypothetical protein
MGRASQLPELTHNPFSGAKRQSIPGKTSWREITIEKADFFGYSMGGGIAVRARNPSP